MIQMHHAIHLKATGIRKATLHSKAMTPSRSLHTTLTWDLSASVPEMRVPEGLSRATVLQLSGEFMGSLVLPASLGWPRNGVYYHTS